MSYRSCPHLYGTRSFRKRRKKKRSWDVVILAVSVFIENEERFEDKLVLNADVNDAISYPGKVLDAAEKLLND